MGDVFAAYEAEFAQLKRTLRALVDSIPSARGEDRLREVRQAEEAMEQAEDLLEKMEFDARHEAKVEGLKRELGGISGLLKKALAKSEYNVEHEALVGGGGVRMRDLDLTSRDHQARYADATAQLVGHGDLIRESTREVEATIGVAQDTMVELDRQHGVIDHARGRLGDVNATLSRAGAVLRGMARRAMTNKLILLAIILFLLGGIALFVWLAWFRHPSVSDDNA